MDVALLSLVGFPFVRPLFREDLEVLVHIVGMGDVLETPLQELGLGVASDVAQRPVDPKPRSVQADERRADWSLVEGPLETRDGISQTRLLLLFSGDVAHRP